MSKYLDRGRFLDDRGRHLQAAREFVSHLAEFPDDPRAHALLAVSLAHLQQFEKALSHARESVRHAPDQGYSNYTVGYVFVRQKRYTEAADWIAKALAIDAENSLYLSAFAGVCAAQGRRRESLEAIDHCLRIDPENTACLNLRASIQLREGKVAAASQTTQMALSLNPEDAQAHVNRAVSLFFHGHMDEGIAAIKDGLRVNPDSVAARATLARTLKYRNPIVRLVISIRQGLAAVAPVALAFIVWQFNRFERHGAMVASPSLVDQLCILAIYLTCAVVVFVKPLSDLYVLCFAAGRIGIPHEERQTAGLAAGIASLFVLVLLASLLSEVRPVFTLGMFLILIAAVPAFPLRLATWNWHRRLMLSLLAVAPLLVYLPLPMMSVGDNRNADPSASTQPWLVGYEASVGIVLMLAMYGLSRLENPLLRLK